MPPRQSCAGGRHRGGPARQWRGAAVAALLGCFRRPPSRHGSRLDQLNNLRTLHLRQPDAPSLVAVLELLTRLPGCPIDEFMRLGQALATLGRPDKGARALEAAADQFGGSDADHLNQAATRLWAQLN